MKKLPPLSQFPYPGLRPFTPHESDIFFGREKHTDQLLKKLEYTHFIAVMGESGHGKSSLVQTGLISSIQAGFLERTKMISWRVAQLHPGEKPLQSLEEALKKAFTSEEGETSVSSQSNSSQEVQRYVIKLRNPSWYLPKDTNLLLLVDQFEEIFTHASSNNEDTKTFVTELLRGSHLSNVYVVISMQSEYSGKCAQFHNLVEAINQGSFLVPRLTHEQLREAIEGPARVFFGEVESQLVDKLVADFGDDPDQLPLMQHALMRIWNKAVAEKKTEIKLTLNHYKDIGEKNALSKHAEELYNKLTSTQPKIAEVLFRNLTDRDEYGDLCRSPVKLGDVANMASVPWEAVADVVKVFCHGTDETDKPNFIKPCENLSPETILEFSHASLIRYWPRLEKWAVEEAEDKELYLRLEKVATTYFSREEELNQPKVVEKSSKEKEGNTSSDLRPGDLDKALEWLKRVTGKEIVKPTNRSKEEWNKWLQEWEEWCDQVTIEGVAKRWAERYYEKRSQSLRDLSFKQMMDFLKRSQQFKEETQQDKIQQDVQRIVQKTKLPSRQSSQPESPQQTQFWRKTIPLLVGAVAGVTAFIISVLTFANLPGVMTGMLLTITWGTLVFLSYETLKHYDRYKELKGTTTKKSKGLKPKRPK